jgi:protein SCO1
LAMMNAVIHELNEKHPEFPTPQVVFVSVDPERDNLAQLEKYTHYFNPHFIGVTGEASQLQSFSRQLGVVFDKVFTDPKYPEQYLMEHSTSIALINPQGSIQAIFTSPHQVDALSQDIVTVMRGRLLASPLS